MKSDMQRTGHRHRSFRASHGVHSFGFGGNPHEYTLRLMRTKTKVRRRSLPPPLPNRKMTAFRSRLMANPSGLFEIRRLLHERAGKNAKRNHRGDREGMATQTERPGDEGERTRRESEFARGTRRRPRR